MKKTLIVLAASLSMGAAFAQSANPAPAAKAPVHHHRAVHHHHRAAAYHRGSNPEQRIAYLHSVLRITPDQESQWKAFADVMRNGAETRLQLSQQFRDARNLSALDNVKQFAQIQQAEADGAQKLVSAFEPLYNSFSPRQKAIADRTFNNRKEAIARRHRQIHRHHKAHAKGAAPASSAAAK